MPQKSFTRSDIHSGVSLTKSDNKWADQLNFRSSDNKTFVVPRKFKILERDAGFHTIIHGIQQDNYAIGSKSSWMFQGNDSTQFIKMWRARLRQKILGDRTLEPLKVRGSYLGDTPETLKITLLNNKLVLDVNWPADPVEPPPLVGYSDIDCGGGKPTFELLVTNVTNDEPIPYARVAIYRGLELYEELVTNPVGRIRTSLPEGDYRLVLTADGFNSKTVYRSVTEDQDSTEALTPSSNYFGVTIRVQYSNTLGPVPGGHSCDAAVYKIIVNGITIGWADLNNADDSGDRLVDLVITAEQAADIVAATGNEYLELEIECDPTYPGFDLLAYSGVCHPDLAWVIVYDAGMTELYNGAPAGMFLHIDF